MDTTLSLGDLLQGTVAAFVGLGGAVIAAFLLIRHERQLRVEANASEQVNDETKAYRDAAAQLSAAAAGLTQELIRPPIMVGAARVALLAALGQFNGVTWIRHRPVAEWTTWAVNQALEEAATSTRRWLLPGGTAARERCARLLGEMMVAIPAWAEGALADEWFAEEFARVAPVAAT